MKILYQYIKRGYHCLVTMLLIVFYAWPFKMLNAQDAESVKLKQKLSSDTKTVINNDLTSAELGNIQSGGMFESKKNQLVSITKNSKNILATHIKAQISSYSNKAANTLITVDKPGSHDTIIFYLGDGHYIVSAFDNLLGDKYGKRDTLILGDDISKNMVNFVQQDDNLIVLVGNQDDQITFIDYFKHGDYQTFNRFEFDDGTVWEDIRDRLFKDDPMELVGTAGDDTLIGGSGNDTITDTWGNNYLDGGAGDDIIKGTGTLIGGKGNDTIYAQTSQLADTIIFNLGDGQDTLHLYEYYSHNSYYKDKLVFGEGISKEMLSMVRTGDDLIISIDDGYDDRITIIDYFKNSYTGRDHLYRIEFADGEVIADFRSVISVHQEGTEGDDTLNGYVTNDVIYGKAGNDLITDAGGNNYIEGGDGDDTITGAGTGISTILGGAGDDIITGAGTLLGGDGNDSITSLGTHNYIGGGDGDDIIKGTGTLIGGKGNDTIYAQTSQLADTIIFNLGDGQDTLHLYEYYSHNSYYKDKLVFGEGISKEMLSMVRTGDDLIISIDDGYDDRITIIDYFKNSYTGRDHLYRIEFADGEVIADFRSVISVHQEGTEGDDTLNGYVTNDVIYGKAGNDLITDAGGNNYIEGGDGDDTITGAGTGISTILGGAGDDIITGAGTLLGGDGNDSITSLGTHNYIGGGDGDDIIKGTGTLIGGKGNDTIYAQTSQLADTIIFNLGDGQDTLHLYEYYSHNSYYKDKLVFGEGISKEMLSMVRTGDDLIISIDDGYDDRITIIDYFKNSYTGRDHLYRIEFADGEVIADFRSVISVHQEGTEGDDTLNGYVTNDVIYGKAGNDLITDAGGNNYIEGGDGDDTITGAGTGISTILGGAGDDIITGAGTLLGGDGNDSITSLGTHNYIGGGDGDDIIKGTGTLIGGKGNDTIYAQTSQLADTIIFNLGDGQDTLHLYEYYSHNSYYKDKLVFGEGISKEMLSMVRTGDDLTISIDDGYDDRITIIDYFKNSYMGRDHLYRIEFADGEVIADFRSVISVHQEGTEGDDTLNGYVTNDVIYGKAGNDLITDAGGNNYIEGGDGDDTITGAGTGISTILGGAGDDIITGAGTLLGGDGNDSITSLGTHNYIGGGDGDDIIKGTGTLIGGKGNDTIYAQTSQLADTIIFNLGDGQDTLHLYEYYSHNSYYKDKLVFGEGISKEMLSMVRTGDDLTISIDDGYDDRITIIDYFKNSYMGRDHLYRIEFADGEVIADFRSLIQN